MSFHIALETRQLPISLIFLDPQNPRFRGCANYLPPKDGEYYFTAQGQELVRRQLMQKAAANHLIESISRLGFVGVDAIVVRQDNADRYVAIEGNRRIAAIKTILNDITRKSISLSEAIISTLDPLEVKVLPHASIESSETLLLQGIRHISGPKSWGPYQQGDLINALLKLRGFTASEAARAVGLSASRVSVLLKGYYGLRQMYEHKKFAHLADTSFFSHFEYAYVKQPVRAWLGWDEDTRTYRNEEHFCFFCERITAAPTSPVLLSARDIRDKLPVILENPSACQNLFEGASIASAFNICAPQSGRWAIFLNNVASFLQCEEEQPIDTITAQYRDQIVKLHELTGAILQADRRV